MINLFELFVYDFFRNAMLASVLASISCGIAGSWIVAKRKVFIAGGVTHASFGGIGLGYFLGMNPMAGGAIFGLASALGIELIAKKTDLREDSAIGIMWSLGMALGIIFIYLTPGYAPNLMSYLFGSILTVGHTELWLMAALSTVISMFFIVFYRAILFISFDEEYAKSHHLPVQLFNGLLMTLTTLVIVLNIKVVGIILVISFLTIPQSTASLLTHKFNAIIGLSVLFGLFGSFTGLYFSYVSDIPSGASIIFSFVIIYLLMRGLTHIVKRRRLRSNLSSA